MSEENPHWHKVRCGFSASGETHSLFFYFYTSAANSHHMGNMVSVLSDWVIQYLTLQSITVVGGGYYHRWQALAVHAIWKANIMIFISIYIFIFIFFQVRDKSKGRKQSYYHLFKFIRQIHTSSRQGETYQVSLGQILLLFWLFFWSPSSPEGNTWLLSSSSIS